MSAFATVDQVAARFPQFARTGPFLALAGIARSGKVVTATVAAPAVSPAAGWNVVIYGTDGGTVPFDGTYQLLGAATANEITTLTWSQAGADESASDGMASLSQPGDTSDGQIQNWLDESADFISAIAASRGYDLAGLPADTADQAIVILRNLNKLGAQVLLGEAIEAQMSIAGQWALLAAVRVESQMMQKNFGAGLYDKLFLAGAKTQDAGPQLGGYVPGVGARPASAAKFRKDQVL